MGNKNTHRMSEQDQALLWECWHSGMSLQKIGTAVGISKPSVFLHLEKYGGYTPRPRQRRPDSLGVLEREEISRGLARGDSLRTIAARLDRSPSTISREVNRNGGREAYRAAQAESRAMDQARRPKACALLRSKRLRRVVIGLLKKDWSPKQIAGWLKKRYPDNAGMQISHETIYKTLFIQSRGALNKQLKDHLRTGRRFRQARTKTLKGQHNTIVDGVSIRERPAQVEDRALPGHWEGDLIAGDQTSFIATVVERKTRYVVLVRVKDRKTKTVVPALIKQMKKLPLELKKTLTWDRGSELAAHRDFSLATDMAVYFCDPYSPWQRGSNENTNGLLRQYFPKGKDVSGYTQAQLNAVARKLNTRPRETLGFNTPAEELEKVLQ
jgi:IS30 family transposase